MLALGSPLHAFDRSLLAEGRIVVRRAQPGEKIRTLDGHERELAPTDLVIADATRPVAIAGIMGGEDSEVRDETTDLLLEAANFDALTVLRTSRRLRLRTDASTRWEKGVDPYAAEQAAVYATELLVAHAGARWTGQTDVHGDLPVPPVVRHRPELVERLSGLSIPLSRAGRAAAAARLRGRRRRRDGAGLAGERRQPPGRSRRGGRAVLDRGGAVDTARARRAVRAADEGAAPPPSHRGRPRRCRLLGGVHVDARPRRGRAAGARGAVHDRDGGAADRPSAGPARVGRAESKRRGRADRTLRDRSRLPADGRGAAGGALARRRDHRGRLLPCQGRGGGAPRCARRPARRARARPRPLRAHQLRRARRAPRRVGVLRVRPRRAPR